MKREILAAAKVLDVRCLMLVGGLDSGGIETVVAALAQGLPAHGIQVDVVCSAGGRTADRLRRNGVSVSRVDASDLPGLLSSQEPDVIQLHRVDPSLMTALLPWAHRTVPVFHAIESYVDNTTWATLARIVASSPACISVSRSVAEYVGAKVHHEDIQVVVNGVPELVDVLLDQHLRERDRLSRAVGASFTPDDTIVVGLQRFSDQKNAAGLVDAFLRAAETDSRLQLVVAGAPDNWLEVRRADILRKMHPMGDRVHFLGDSDPLTLLLGGDVFALDSFAEGGPVVALEAASFGLPTVLSDVGFARQLLRASKTPGLVVQRANAEVTQAAIARERRRRHQSNREQFAQALLLMARETPRVEHGVPEGFSEREMIAGHAQILHRAAKAPRS